MVKMVTNLWFEDQAEEAANFYESVFEDSQLGGISRYPDEGQEITGQVAGAVMTVSFEVNGMSFMALNGGKADYSFNEAISFVVNCDTQDEVDRYWDALTADGGQEVQCGWLKDKYGLSWQIVPNALGELLSSDDPEVTQKAMRAMLGMKKIVIADLRAAVA